LQDGSDSPKNAVASGRDQLRRMASATPARIADASVAVCRRSCVEIFQIFDRHAIACTSSKVSREIALVNCNSAHARHELSATGSSRRASDRTASRRRATSFVHRHAVMGCASS